MFYTPLTFINSLNQIIIILLKNKRFNLEVTLVYCFLSINKGERGLGNILK